MGNMIRLAILVLTRLVIRLRYRVRVHGWEQIRDLRGPILLLPNHPAFIDPALILATFYGQFRPRTVLYEGNFGKPIRSMLVKLLRAVAIPDLQQPSRDAHLRTEQAIAEIIQGLQRGDNFLLWPSGRVQRDGVERLGPARALTDLLRKSPQVSLVLVRTRGLWGSSFSFAPTGQMPSPGRCLLKGVLFLAANLLFFMPRRKVDISVELIDRHQLPTLEWKAVNRWFQDRYNPEGAETPTYVPYHFLCGPRSYHFPEPTDRSASGIDDALIQPEVREAVAELLSHHLGRPILPEELSPRQRLDDLGLDSLQRMDLSLAAEQQFNVSTRTVPETVGGLLTLAVGLSEQEFSQPPREWFRAPAQVEVLQIPEETIPAAFISRALRSRRDIAVADDLSGVLTYEQLLIGALIVADRFRRLPGINVGLMLPASVASDIMLYGLYLARKCPVLLNWTTGPANLQHAVQLTGITHVVTSRQLRDRLGLAIPGVQTIDVEDLRKEMHWFDKVRWWLMARCCPGTIRCLASQTEATAQGVILFTSGSEKAPKAVPLTHANVISNARVVIEVLNMTNQDSILGCLPMFHSFGFTLTGLAPLLSGLRTIHHPDPTDIAGLSQKIVNYKPRVLVGIPYLIARLFERARPGDLDSLRILVAGAEKVPSSLFETVDRVLPEAVLLEGYGVTECSPTLIANRPEARRQGSIGRPLPGIDIRVVDLETDQDLPAGKMGMLLVSGPGVFSGYLGDEASPFVQREGRRWYVTGDLVEQDVDGFVYFRGRLKRFLKAGGEMISLPALEEPFHQCYPIGQNGPRVAVEGIETASGRKIVLFTTESLTLIEANRLLAEAGFRGVMRLDEVRQLGQIPVLGNGKTDYRQLRGMIEAEAPCLTRTNS